MNGRDRRIRRVAAELAAVLKELRDVVDELRSEGEEIAEPDTEAHALEEGPAHALEDDEEGS